MKIKTITLKWALPILAVIATVLLVCYVYASIQRSESPWFWGYWSLIGLVVFCLIISACFSVTVRSYLGTYCRNLRTNNNYPWFLHLALAVIISISAMLNGFGRPILSSSAKELKGALIQKIGERTNLTYEIKRSLWGTNDVPSLFERTSAPPAEKQYPSWWWWIWSIILFVGLIIHAPFAFHDEAIEAMKAALKAVKRRKRLDNIQSSTVATAAAPAAATTTASTTAPAEVITTRGIFMKIFQAEALIEFLEIFLKLVVKKIFNK